MISKGKWECREYVSPKGRFYVSVVGTIPTQQIAKITDNAEKEDNAHLIAASKLLLAACKKAEKHLTFWFRDETDKEKIPYEVLTPLRQAITAAKPN